MANRYGSESIAIQFRDLQATTLSLDKTGSFALLAGRKYLAVLNLDESCTDKLLVRVPYGGKYEISSTQWAKGDDKHLAVASSQRCDIFQLTESSNLKCSIRLKGHTRVITDLDWSSLHPSLLASSSFDSFVHIWDIRIRNNSSADKPQFSLSALDGASQVRWNRATEDILASCDGGHVKIWDLRKPNSPSEFIAAHASKINGLEWANSDTIITAAQDCTVKFSKLSAENKAKGPILSLTAPVWRARPAPFGRGVVTQCVPILRRDSGLLSLWDWQQRFPTPIFTFQAYDIIEFAWRRTVNTANYDLITWSRDQTLRIWTLPKEIVQLCGGDEENIIPSTMMASMEDGSFLEAEAGIELTEEESPPSSPTTTSATPVILKNKRTATLERRSRKSSSPSSPLNRRDFLKAEFEKVETEKPENINFDQIELDKGLLRFSWSSKVTAELSSSNKGRVGITAGILASFPNGYPAAPPTFLVTNASSEVDKNHVVKCLKNLAQQFSKKSEQCLGKCVEQFSNIMNAIKTLEDVEQGYFPNVRGVSNVPFPRTSGARFCAVGMLVCFGRPSYLKRVKSNCDSGTPRALSALGPYLSQVALENEDIKHRRSHHHRRHEKKRAGVVTLFDVSPLLPFDFKLARDYKHIVASPRARQAAFDINFGVASTQKKCHVANIWTAASVISSFAHPVKKKEFEDGIGDTQIVALHDMTDDEEEYINWVTHSAQYGDFQTAATLACLFTSTEHLPSPTATGNELVQFKKQGAGQGHRQTVPRLTVPKWWTKGIGSPYHTVHGSDTHGVIMNPLSAETFFRQHRSNSWSDSLDDIKTLHLLHSAGVSQELMMLGNGGSGPSGGDGPSYHSSSGGIQILAHQNNHSRGQSHHGIIVENSVPISALSVYSSNGNGMSNNGGNWMIRTNTTIVCITKPMIPVVRGVLLDEHLHRFYDRYKKSYAEILLRWSLLQQRAEILKNLTEISESNTITRIGVNFSVVCRTCGETSKGPYCIKCKRIVSICSVCHIPAKGLSTYCPKCGHGGHAICMGGWFGLRKVCPNACGCHCITEPLVGES